RVDCFPARAAFPKWQEGRHPHCHFRGLLRLHSRYGPPDRSAAQRRPLSRGSNPCGYPAEPLVSYRINRQLSGWNPPPLVIRAFGAHCQYETSVVFHTRTRTRSVAGTPNGADDHPTRTGTCISTTTAAIMRAQKRSGILLT